MADVGTVGNLKSKQVVSGDPHFVKFTVDEVLNYVYHPAATSLDRASFTIRSDGELIHVKAISGRPHVYKGQHLVAWLRKPGDSQSVLAFVDIDDGKISGLAPGGYLFVMALLSGFIGLSFVFTNFAEKTRLRGVIFGTTEIDLAIFITIGLGGLAIGVAGLYVLIRNLRIQIKLQQFAAKSNA